MLESADCEPEDAKTTREKQEREMKRFRYDIMKFGMTGFGKQKAYEAKIALAVSLGAKPHKNKKQNYKDLMAERKKAKEKEQRKEKMASGLGSSLTKLRARKRTKKENGILGVYGKVQKDSTAKSR